jgi:putative ABC transport system permease protein
MITHLRLAFRSLSHTPGFTAIAILTLALGIGMNTAMFSMLNGFLLRPLSYPHVGQLFRLDRASPQRPFGDHSVANVSDLTRESAGFADLAAFRYWGFTLTEPDHPADMPFALRVTANYFDVLGVKPEYGRGFLPEEDAVGKNNVIIISHTYWKARFGGAPNTLGRTVRIDGAPTEIVGILSASDEADATRLTGALNIYRPMGFSTGDLANRTDNSVSVIGRCREGVTPSQTAAQFATLARRLASDHPAENANLDLRIRSLQSTTLAGVGRTTTFLLIGLSGFVLLIACGNLANLLLARAIARAREFSIRAALGASRTQLLKPLALECLLLAIGGGLAATLVSVWTSAWLAQRFGGPGNAVDFSTDGRVLFFTIALSLLTALLFGVAPAWWAARVDVNDSLKSGARGSTGSRAQHSYRQVLLVAQFALALILLAGAGFFIGGIARLTHVRSGWHPDALITGSVNLASTKYNSAEPIIAFHNGLRERLLALPGVANVAVSYEEPLFDAPAQRSFRVEGREPPLPGQEAVAFTNGVSASYFDTVGTRLRRGRLFDTTDTLTSQPVVVINETMARTLFPGQEALGHRLGVVDNNPVVLWAEIVGIVEDVHAQRVQPSPIVFQVYKPFVQEAWQYVTISVRASDPARIPALLDPIRRTVAALDPDQPVTNLLPALLRIERNVGFWQTINQLLILFAGLGLLLAALGVYGVTARLVAQRTAEIGLRLALGAQIRDIVKLVLGGGLRTTLTGAVVGLIGAFLLSYFLTQKLPVFGGNGILPVATATVLLVTLATLACWLPAWRATKVDPAVALRSE